MESVFSIEFKEALSNKDFSLLTRRLLDACKEHEVPMDLQQKIILMRKKYLSFLDGVSDSISRDEAEDLIKQLNIDSRTIKSGLFPNQPVLTAAGITKQFIKGKTPFKLHELSLELIHGEITGVVGENGNGKTTLLNLLAGNLSVSSGEILYPNLSQNNHDYYSIKQQIAFIPQRIDKWYGTLMENLQFFCAIHNIKGEQNEQEIEYILCRLGLEKFKDLSWNEISSGYRLRFELAKMLLWRPQLLILDEPLANLDINAQQLLLQDLKFFVRSKVHPLSIILSSQNLHELERIADNIVFIRQGKTVFNGKQNQFGRENLLQHFEISGNFSLKELQVAFPGTKIEDTGTTYIVSVNKETKWFEILSKLNQHNLELNYYRNITNSTRQLFHKDI
ncbi:MAG: ABC transporter ATP-binding protein [Bacteroidetes bacterium]|nr:ABC transporter ATP-binding protein [Bacteroidota bacterium]MCA6444575.1 ABC transporter ATP-binding protein [Bacteroidota bacterium]